jgi:putative ABC transport system permease protein
MGGPELLRFAVGGLWRQKVRTALTLVGVTVGTCALAFSLSLGLGLRAFIDREFQGRDGFWRIIVRADEPPPDPDDIPPAKLAVPDTIAPDRRARIRDALVQKYLADKPRKPLVMLTPDRVAAIAALPGVREVRTYRTNGGWAWLGDRSAPAQVVSGRLAGLDTRLLAGRIPDDAGGGVAVSEFVLFELGVRDEAGFDAALGKPLQVDVGGVRNTQPMALARALTGWVPTESLSRAQSRALEKLIAALPKALDQFGLTPEEQAELQALMSRKQDPDEERRDPTRVATGEYRVAAVLRHLTREDRKRHDPLAPWELTQGDVFLPPGPGEELFSRLPGVREAGVHHVEVWMKPDSDLPGTVERIEAMGYGTFSALKWFHNAKREVTLIAAGLNLFAMIALFVAAVGITNTLVTSVVERTREIGILKAVGATSGQVLGIFLTEGAVIGLLGAGLGLGLARGLIFPADGWVRGLIQGQMPGNEKMLSESIFVFPWWLWVGAVAFAVVVTTTAAYYPARRAARIDPIQALKYE